MFRSKKKNNITFFLFFFFSTFKSYREYRNRSELCKRGQGFTREHLFDRALEYCEYFDK